MTNTEYYFIAVKQFMTTFDQRMYRFTSDVPETVLDLRASLIEEELLEYEEALRINNRLELLDGLCDLVYVVAGTIAACGLTVVPFTNTKDNKEYSVEPYVSNVVEECQKPVPCHKRMYRVANECLGRLETIGTKMRLAEAFNEVHRNNMEKLWKEKPSDANLIAIAKGNKWYVRNKQGKIVKPVNHPRPNLAKFL